MSWHSFFGLDAGFAKSRSPVTAVARTPDHLDVFVSGTDEEASLAIAKLFR